MLKKILIASATSASNLQLAINIKEVISNLKTKDFEIDTQIVNLETIDLPLYSTPKEKMGYPKGLNELVEKFQWSDGLIICAPEYNGSIPPVVTNAIAWMSVITENWRDVFNHKIGIVASSSGGAAIKYQLAMKSQLEHLGMTVLPRSIIVNGNQKLKFDSVEKNILQFLKYI